MVSRTTISGTSLKTLLRICCHTMAQKATSMLRISVRRRYSSALTVRMLRRSARTSRPTFELTLEKNLLPVNCARTGLHTAVIWRVTYANTQGKNHMFAHFAHTELHITVRSTFTFELIAVKSNIFAIIVHFEHPRVMFSRLILVLTLYDWHNFESLFISYLQDIYLRSANFKISVVCCQPWQAFPYCIVLHLIKNLWHCLSTILNTCVHIHQN